MSRRGIATVRYNPSMREAWQRGVMVLALGLVGACGRITQHSEKWTVVEGATPKDPRVWVWLESTHADVDAGAFRDREITDGAPYTFVVSTDGDYVDAPLRLHAAAIMHGDQVTPLHDGATPLEAALVRGSDGKPSSARIEIALGDRLVWHEGDVVSLLVQATLPWETAPMTVTRELRAELSEYRGTKLDAILGQ